MLDELVAGWEMSGGLVFLGVDAIIGGEMVPRSRHADLTWVPTTVPSILVLLENPLVARSPSHLLHVFAFFVSLSAPRRCSCIGVSVPDYYRLFADLTAWPRP